MALLEFTAAGLHCPIADVYIDPNRKVDRALITHGHSDHARPGHKYYLCSDLSKPILKLRLGKINVESVAYGEKVSINGVEFSFHPAGHIIGSAQIRVAYKGEVWVASGDYKVEDDGISGRFEVVKCNTFITETTFALPIYQWKPQQEVFDDMNRWWSENKEARKTCMINAYSLGKAQRIIANVDRSIGSIFCHTAVQKMNETLINSGVNLPATRLLDPKIKSKDFEGALVISSSTGDAGWKTALRGISNASASGWMQLRGRRSWGGQDRGFVLSDHADWKGLNYAIKATGAETIYVTHGYTSIYSRWLKEQGYDARIVPSRFAEKEDQSTSLQ